MYFFILFLKKKLKVSLPSYSLMLWIISLPHALCDLSDFANISEMRGHAAGALN